MTELNAPYTPVAEKQLKVLFNLLGLRIIPGYFLQANPEKFQQWHYNCCNQTALITAVILSWLLESPGKDSSNPWLHSYWDIRLFEGIFTEDDLPGSYNHAYIHAVELNGEKLENSMSFFIDVGRMSNPTIFKMGYNVSDLPVHHSSNYQMHTVKQLNLTKMLTEDHEYFTGKTGFEISDDIEKILHKLGFDILNFNWKS